jgi:holliday junction DNA helicase RuvA
LIGRLKGILIEKHPPELVIDMHGVGYEVLAPLSTFYQLPSIGGEVVLYTHFSVSENAQQLFGFFSKEDRSLFRLLIKVNSVGPKMALGIMSGMESDDFVRCVRDSNVSALVKVPGVGKKTAERLVIEMRDRLADWHTVGSGSTITSVKTVQSSANEMVAEAESALIALGYKPAEASRAVNAVLNEHAVERCEELIRLALRGMMPK